MLVAGSATAHAQPGVLAAVDELMTAGRYDAALSLLDHAQGTPGEIAGRRALCASHLGRPQEAATQVAVALQFSTDPWVTAHHADLLSALSAQPATATMTTGPAEAAGRLAESPSPSPAAPATPAPPTGHIPDSFVLTFGTTPVPDVPEPRVPLALPRRRWTLRGMLGAGVIVPVHVWKGLERIEQVQGDDHWTIDTDTAEKARSAVQGTLGVELEWLALPRLALVAGVDGILGGSLSSSVQVSHSSLSNYPYGSSTDGRGPLGATYGVRGSALFRILPRGGSFVLGLGARVGTIHARVRGDLSAYNGSKAGSFDLGVGGLTTEGLFEIGGAFGKEHRYMVLTRVGFGRPTVTAQLLVGVPLTRRSR